MSEKKLSTVRVLGLSGSLRTGSYNRKLLDAAAAMLPAEVEFQVYEGLADIPPYREDDEVDPPEPVRTLRETISAADALLIATPEYNASIPGHLKNSIDWASRPFRNSSLLGKPVVVIGASTGSFGAVWAQAELRKVLNTIGSEVIEGELPVSQAHDAFTEDGRLADPALASTLSDLVTRLVKAAKEKASEKSSS